MSNLSSLAKSFAAPVLETLGLAWLRTLGRRPGDTFLCSYPKSGRTWLRFMLSAYQVRLFRVDLVLTMANFASVSPNLTLGTRMGLRTRLPDPRMRRVYGTHRPYSAWLHRARLIYLERDLRDVLVSFYHHQRARGTIPEGLDAYVRSPAGLAAAIAYLRGWRMAMATVDPTTICQVRYEGLLADPCAELRRCVAFLGLPVDDELVAQAVQDGEADKLRLLEAAAGSYDFTPEQLRANPNASHIRKARAGTHRDEMDAALADHILAECRRQGVTP